ncbi:MAG: endolytic transglycosylase MltG [Hyphomicrobium sp.]
MVRWPSRASSPFPRARGGWRSPRGWRRKAPSPIGGRSSSTISCAAGSGPSRWELKAGDYEIQKNASMAQIMETLTQGRGVLSKITIPEGMTSLQIVDKLRQEDELVGDIAEIPPEGSLLPDTYRFSKGMERRELIERMQGEMQRFLATAWERRQPSLPISTPEEAVIFA